MQPDAIYILSPNTENQHIYPIREANLPMMNWSGKMKFGLRKPSLKKSIKARTTGRLKRQVKRAVNPFYGKKGMGWIRDPKRASYNKVYRKTTFGIRDLLKALFK